MIRIQVMENGFVLGPVEIHPAHRDGHDLRAGCLDRLDHLRVGRVLPGPDHQPRAELATRDHERLRIGQRRR